MEEISQEQIDFCREVGKLARKYNLSSFHGMFRPPILEIKDIKQIEFDWEQGRHGEESKNITIHSEYWTHTKITE